MRKHNQIEREDSICFLVLIILLVVGGLCLAARIDDETQHALQVVMQD